MINWSRIEQEKFERIVDVLLRRAYGEDDHVVYDEADQMIFPDGRGGDGGRDAVLIGAGRHLIFQLKYFLEGFPSANPSRRRQITKSFDTAMRHTPTHWYLVVPGKLTDGERSFVQALAQRAKAPPGLVVEILDRPWLDDQAAQHRDLDFHFTRDDEVTERTRTYNAERAMLQGPDDLTARLSALKDVIDARDLDWTLDFTVNGEVITKTLRARHSSAAEVSPITIDVGFEFGEQDDELAEALRGSLGFGEPGAITVPAKNIAHWKVNGPSWLSQDHERVEVSWYPQTSPPTIDRVEVRVLDANGSLVLADEGAVEHVGGGSMGYSLRVRFHDVLEMKWRFPHDQSEPGHLSYSLEMAGAKPGEVLGAIALARALHQSGPVQLWVEGRRLTTLDAGASGAIQPPWLEDIAAFKLLAEDLEIVQRHCRTAFAIPDPMTNLERIALRMARLLLDGRRVAHPLVRELTGTRTMREAVEPKPGSELAHALTAPPGTLGMRVGCPDLVITLGHRELCLGPAIFATEHGEVREQVRPSAAPDSETTEVDLILAVPDGERFDCYLPDRISDDQLLVTTPWDLPGINEAGHLTER